MSYHADRITGHPSRSAPWHRSWGRWPGNDRLALVTRPTPLDAAWLRPDRHHTPPNRTQMADRRHGQRRARVHHGPAPLRLAPDKPPATPSPTANHPPRPDLRAHHRQEERAVTDHRDERNPSPEPAMPWNAAGHGSPSPYEEPVRRAGERPGPEVASEGTALGSAGERVAQPAELPPEAVPAGFRLEPVGDRVRLFHHCGKVVRVDDPTDPQIRWYLRTHRCGPATSEWHIGAIEQPPRRYRATPAHCARSRSTPQPHRRGPHGVV